MGSWFRGQGRDLIWVVLLCILAGSAVWNLTRARTLAGELQRTRSEQNDLISRVLFAEGTAHKLVGHRLNWPKMDQITDFPESLWDDKAGPRLILFFRDVSCTLCDEQEVAFANRLVEQVGPGHFAAVVEAADRRYAAAFLRVNRMKFPLYYDGEKAFGGTNPLKASPLVLLVNERREVLAAHNPVSGKPAFCRAFETAGRRLFFRGEPPAS